MDEVRGSTGTGGCLGGIFTAIALPVVGMILLAVAWSAWPWVLGALLVGAALTAWDAQRGRPEVWRTYLRMTPVIVGLGALISYAVRGLLGVA